MQAPPCGTVASVLSVLFADNELKSPGLEGFRVGEAQLSEEESSPNRGKGSARPIGEEESSANGEEERCSPFPMEKRRARPLGEFPSWEDSSLPARPGSAVPASVTHVCIETLTLSLNLREGKLGH